MKKQQNKKFNGKEIAKDQATGPAIPINNSPLPQQQFIHQESFAGPLPPPSILAGYRNIDATFPERILKEFEDSSSHIREMDKKALQAKIDSVKRGQYIACGLSLLLIGMVFYSLHLGNTTFAGVGFLAFFTIIITAFVNRDKKNQETEIPKSEK
ncbi:DUF2335 domain-containing protein [uncultured Succiniclasticum sp.]|uniref:DUF2335 domain-containing protein n=1 Tax=uncultured Succiniclasticum sp. TaxID=1500547 RepID=UPI0025DC0052|nr:DUF2335 domain-containing protein [uncultured Succiniclasticum sp.]